MYHAAIRLRQYDSISSWSWWDTGHEERVDSTITNEIKQLQL